MKAKITFKECNISVECNIECMSKYSISFELPKEYNNPFVWGTLDRLGASVAELSTGLYVIVNKESVIINYQGNGQDN